MLAGLFRRLAGPSSDMEQQVRRGRGKVRREMLYDRGRDYEVMNPQFEGVVMICKRYGLHSDRLGGRE
jgi:hypothetical protein